MIQKTNGIVLHAVKYSETNLIVKIYTLQFGLQSYILNNTRSKKSKNKASFLQPLALVEIVVSANHKNKLQRITEITILEPYYDIPFNIHKSAIIIFLNEILYKSIKEDHSDINLFEFIKNSLLMLDLNTANCSNFHIYFMIQLSKYLGFYPEEKIVIIPTFFDLKEGRFLRQRPFHPHYLTAENSEILCSFINTTYDELHLIRITKAERKQILQALILYYQLHIQTIGEIKSLDVLEEIAA
ncbi:MAG: DNA repair protein RecO [Bacteroidia bacterium]